LDDDNYDPHDNDTAEAEFQSAFLLLVRISRIKIKVANPRFTTAQRWHISDHPILLFHTVFKRYSHAKR